MTVRRPGTLQPPGVPSALRAQLGDDVVTTWHPHWPFRAKVVTLLILNRGIHCHITCCFTARVRSLWKPLFSVENGSCGNHDVDDMVPLLWLSLSTHPASQPDEIKFARSAKIGRVLIALVFDACPGMPDHLRHLDDAAAMRRWSKVRWQCVDACRRLFNAALGGKAMVFAGSRAGIRVTSGMRSVILAV